MGSGELWKVLLRALIPCSELSILLLSHRKSAFGAFGTPYFFVYSLPCRPQSAKAEIRTFG